MFSTFTPQIPAWETPSPHQYHIQTDEGPERYFRYQTDSGQYRKEKRLEDGTVVGTYAWIDADGMLFFVSFAKNLNLKTACRFVFAGILVIFMKLFLTAYTTGLLETKFLFNHRLHWAGQESYSILYIIAFFIKNYI